LDVVANVLVVAEVRQVLAEQLLDALARSMRYDRDQVVTELDGFVLLVE